VLDFQIVSVQGNSVRIRSGIFVVDCRIERRAGRLFVQKPPGAFVFPQILGAMVAAALDAYETAERKMTGGI
jgi:hypothetical protein